MLITPNQAAVILGVDDSTIRRLIHLEKLQGKKIGGRYLLRTKRVLAFKAKYTKWAREHSARKSK